MKGHGGFLKQGMLKSPWVSILTWSNDLEDLGGYPGIPHFRETMGKPSDGWVIRPFVWRVEVLPSQRARCSYR